jgi:hypothetical protein
MKSALRAVAVSRTRAIVFSLLVGFSTHAAHAKTIEPDAADAFEKSASAAAKAPGVGRLALPERVYVQPLNKSAPCKLRTTSDQLARSNLKVYWDGACKNGFAFGLGRDIAISDTHHVEEITEHHGAGQTRAGDSFVTFDFAAKSATYRQFITDTEDSQLWLSEMFQRDDGGNVFRVIKGRIERSGEFQITRTPRIATPVTLAYMDPAANVIYRQTDWTDVPQDQPAMVFEVFDAQSHEQSPWTLVEDRAGKLHGFEGVGSGRRPVELPDQYVRRMLDKARQTRTVEQQVDVAYGRAKTMERQYLYGVCENDRQSPGIPVEMYKKICALVAGFEGAKNTALTSYAAALDEARAQQTARQTAQQAARQVAQQAAQGAVRAPVVATPQRESAGDLNSAIADFNRAMVQARERAEQMNRSLPAVNTTVPSFAPRTNRVMNCTTISGFTTCR